MHTKIQIEDGFQYGVQGSTHLVVADDGLTASAQTNGAASGTANVLSVLVTALTADITSNLNVEVELGVAGRQVLEDGDVGDAIGSLANTKNGGSPVTGTVRSNRAVPETSVLGTEALGVDVVLSRCGQAGPVVVVGLAGVGDFNALTGSGNGGDGHALGTRVISSASRDLNAQVILNGNAALTGDAKSLVGVAGKLEVTVAVAVKTTNRLLGSTLGPGPLSLLVTGRAHVGAHGVGSAGLAEDSSDDLADAEAAAENEARDTLNTSVATHAEPISGNGTILGGELTALDLAAGEISVKSSGTARDAVGLSNRRLGLRRSLDGRLRRRGGGLGSRRGRRGRGGRRSLGFDELGSEILASGWLGRRRSVGRGGLSNDDELAILETSLGLLLVEDVVAQLVNGLGSINNNLGDNIGSTLVDLGGFLLGVKVAVVVLVSSSARGHGDREGVSNGELHGECCCRGPTIANVVRKCDSLSKENENNNCFGGKYIVGNSIDRLKRIGYAEACNWRDLIWRPNPFAAEPKTGTG